MSGKSIPIQIFYFLLFIAIQLILLRNAVLFNIAFCFVYIAFILLLPLETPPLILLILGFVTGFVVDIFYDTLGIHTASCVIVAFIRPFVIKTLTPGSDYEPRTNISIKLLGLQWFSIYSSILIFVHHVALFYIEIASARMFFFTLAKAFFSTIFTFVVIVIIQYLFFYSKKRR